METTSEHTIGRRNATSDVLYRLWIDYSGLFQLSLRHSQMGLVGRAHGKGNFKDVFV